MTTTTNRWHRQQEDAVSSDATIAPTETGRDGSRLHRTWRGRPEDAAWVRPALFGLLVATAVLYLWDLSASGYANSFYSAAVQAGSKSWEAFFFGSSDAANSITVDKPPASLWVMAISVRIFGLSSWAILAPQALMGVATVGVLYAAVRRAFSPVAGLLAGAALALTPVAALMFRFNNPDAMLVLVMTVAAFCVLRACEDARTRWLVATGVLVGLGFLTKQLQVFLVLPPLALTYLIAAPTGLFRRIRQLLVGGLAMVLAAGWWLAIVELTPASMRPYIGGSQNNSILELTFGYNGFGRLTGNETGSVGGGGGGTGTGMWGETGITRLFTGEFGGQIAWLAPAALILLVAALWFVRKAPRTDLRRAALVLWGTWMLTTGLVFSFMHGIFHQYYTVALAPAIAALVAIGAEVLWRRRQDSVIPMGILGLVTGVSAAWSFVLLDRSADFVPWLRWAVLILGLVAGSLLALAPLLSRKILLGAAAVAVVAGLAGPTAYTIQTVGTAHTGSIVTAGPTVAGSTGFGGGGGGGGRGGFGGGQPPTGTAPGGTTTQGGTTQGGTTGTTQGGTTGTTGPTGGMGGMGGMGGGGMGGLLNGSTASSEMIAALQENAGDYTWVAAAIGSNTASGYQLGSEEPVMAIGGFNGSDPSPTLAQFQQYVANGEIHYFIGGSGVGGQSSGGSNAASEISTWVAANYTATTIGSTTVYDLSSGSTATAS